MAENDRSSLPIGVFDSGVGGFTVVRALRRKLPSEDIIYLGDTARVPYGTKSPETVIRYSLNNARFLHAAGIKVLVVACNTASAHSIKALRSALDIPVIGVIEPGARAACSATKNGLVGVIGTRGTVESRSYAHHISEISAGKVTTQGLACPLFVPLAEEGWLSGEVPRLTALHYMQALHAILPDMDTLVLGCTHYPLLSAVINEASSEIFGHSVSLIDSGVSSSYVIGEILKDRGLENPDSERKGVLKTCVTDTSHIETVGELFLGEPLGTVERVDV
ncbi:glutamate racemase [Myxococcota bacterium]|nr:glutamate racemase [Myxococcota bacterium]MBU1379181.1 glutamate racemase [Myxococcota bacterium]MBU1497501.1 glutamate racemase [Myxococcota bacterium]